MHLEILAASPKDFSQTPSGASDASPAAASPPSGLLEKINRSHRITSHRIALHRCPALLLAPGCAAPLPSCRCPCAGPLPSPCAPYAPPTSFILQGIASSPRPFGDLLRPSACPCPCPPTQPPAWQAVPVYRLVLFCTLAPLLAPSPLCRYFALSASSDGINERPSPSSTEV